MSQIESPIFILIGPSGVGKSTVIAELNRFQDFVTPISHTTRAQRVGEPDTAYHFISESAFQTLVANSAFAETIVYDNANYGYTYAELAKTRATNLPTVIIADIAGAEILAQQYPAIQIGLLPPNPWHKHLAIRMQQRKDLKEAIADRLLLALAEVPQIRAQVDYVVYNFPDAQLLSAVTIAEIIATHYHTIKSNDLAN